MIEYGLSNIPGLVSSYDLDNIKSCSSAVNLLGSWTDYGGNQANYAAYGNNIKLLNTSTAWVGYFPITITGTGYYMLEFSYQADTDGSALVVDNDGIMDNSYNVSLTANITPKCHFANVFVNTTGSIQMFFRRNGGGNITVSNVKFYREPSEWFDLINPSLNLPGNPFWANNVDSITISLVLHKVSTVSGYAEHPVSKWNQSYADNASFILYHFGTTSGAADSIGWYGNVNQDINSGWTNISSGATLTNGTYNHIVLQYSCALGGQLWVNGQKVGGRTAGGMLGQTILSTNSTTGDINIFGPAMQSSRVNHIQFYNRQLNDNEILVLYNVLKKRFVSIT